MHQLRKNNEQQHKNRTKKYINMVPTFYLPTPSKTWTNQPPTFPPPLSFALTTQMITISLAQMRQSDKCGSVRNDKIFNLHLGSGAGPWDIITCILQDTSHINWHHLPKQSNKKKQKILKKYRTPKNCIILPWPTYTEPRADRGSPGAQL